ncbi:hypothetical protein MTP99_011280 [Tenebrio molitor]|nr:hypothetical protein MTP99_011280 [Tenebrio molitor]
MWSNKAQPQHRPDRIRGLEKISEVADLWCFLHNSKRCQVRQLKLTAIPSHNLPVGTHNKTVKCGQTTNSS